MTGASDQGLLFLFKPNLLGEEPDDIQQYRRRNQAFPQESTGDQFYDEAQWESYRRLGEHAARSAFRFLERISVDERPSRYYVFTEAFWRWCRTPGGLSAEMPEQTLRSINFINRLRDSNCQQLLGELLPEVVELHESDDTGKLVLLLMELTQVMEDAFVALNLGETFSHPLNAGWGNQFRRWTESALYRRWWPVLQPLYSRPFRQFLDDEFGLEAFSPGTTKPTGLRNIVPLTDEMQNDESWKSFALRYPERATTAGEKLLLRIDFGNGKFLCVGLLTWTPDNGTATWTADDLFVRPPLRGVNIIAAFLPELLNRLRPNSTVEVKIDSNIGERRTDAAYRAFHADRLRMYMALGFKLRKRQGRQYLTRKL